MPPTTSILYQNPTSTAFILDIPTSLTLAQSLPSQSLQRHLLSSSPLTSPYPQAPEPKTDAARKRVLDRIPAAERVIHGTFIGPLVSWGLTVLRDGMGGGEKWCFGRRAVDDPQTQSQGDFILDEENDGDENGPLPPVILSSTDTNIFASLSELQHTIVGNPSSDEARIQIQTQKQKQTGSGLYDETRITPQNRAFTIPPSSKFLLCRLPISESYRPQCPIPGLGDRKFNLIVLDPPWSNRSVRRSGYYKTQAYFEEDLLTRYIGDVLRSHLHVPDISKTRGCWNETKPRNQPQAIAAIWITNSIKARNTAYSAISEAGLSVTEEWVWVKTTIAGEPIMPVDGLWRKPYEVLVIGERRHGRQSEIRRRVIAAVPDVHSRKPNLKEVFEKVFFGDSAGEYAALEVFARNLTAGWWACGDEVLKFNEEVWWVDSDSRSSSGSWPSDI